MSAGKRIATRLQADGSDVAMSAGRLMVRCDLGFDARQRLIAAACSAIASADTAGTLVELDCSAVDSLEAVDDAVVGMLVVVARAARRRGERVVLVRAPKSMRAQLEAADVAHFFNFRP